MAQRIEVALIGDSSSLERALKRAQGSSSKFGSSFGKVAKGIGFAAAGAGVAVAGGFIATLKNGFDELAESQKVAAQTEAVIKSTGKAANVTEKQIASYAEELSKLSGTDDEVIQSGENMLLTFTNIRNEAGKGNDVFKQATATLLDMSVALGTDMNKSAIQLGKALNDPIKGIASLSRVGVTFTADQKAMIAGMVEAGDTMGAQKLILQELNKEFGGSAKAFGETMPGQLAKLRNSFDEVSGELATKFLPMLIGVVEWVNEHWAEISAVIGAVGTAVQATFRALGAAIGWLKTQWEIHQGTVKRTWATIQTAVQGVVRWFQSNVVPAIRNVVTVLRALWNTFGETIKSVLRTDLALALKLLTTWIQNMLAPFKIFIKVLKGDWQGAWNEIKATFSRTIGAILAIMRGYIDNFLAVGKLIMGGLFDGIKKIWENIKSFFSRLGGRIKSALGDVSKLLWSAGWSIMTSLWNGMKHVWEQIQGWVGSLGGLIKGLKGPLAKDKTLLLSEGRAIMGGLEKGLNEGWQPIAKMLTAATASIASPSLSYAGAPALSYAPEPFSVSSAGGGGTTVHVENMHVQNDRDIELIAARVAQRLALR